MNMNGIEKHQGRLAQDTLLQACEELMLLPITYILLTVALQKENHIDYEFALNVNMSNMLKS